MVSFTRVTIMATTTPLSDRERAEAIGQLEASAGAVAAAVGGLTVAQWTFRPAADRWSIAECVEHIAIVEERVLGRVGGLAQAPAAATRAQHADDKIIRFVQDRSSRLVAPEVLQPRLRWSDPPAGIARFEAARQRSIDFLRTTDVDLRARTAPHPVFGDLDAYQWFLASSGHTLRHLAQIEEIKAEPGYPSSAAGD
jgi:hypothetical protein